MHRVFGNADNLYSRRERKRERQGTHDASCLRAAFAQAARLPSKAAAMASTLLCAKHSLISGRSSSNPEGFVCSLDST